jgi:hypothetical protein
MIWQDIGHTCTTISNSQMLLFGGVGNRNVKLNDTYIYTFGMNMMCFSILVFGKVY